MIAARVKGIPILKKSLFFTVCPDLRRIPIPVIFADAPMGVQFPPRVAPESRPKYRRVGSIPRAPASPVTTGSIVATYGMLSINAEISTDAYTITV